MKLNELSCKRGKSQPNSLSLFRQFYRDYNKMGKTQSSATNQPMLIKLKSSSIDKFSNFLGFNKTMFTQSSQDSSFREVSKLKDLEMKKLKKIRLSNNQQKLKLTQTFYPSNSTKQHPFFNPHQGIKQFKEINPNYNQEKQSKFNHRNVTSLFKQMQQKKKQSEAIRIRKKIKSKEIRYNWLSEKLYRKFDDNKPKERAVNNRNCGLEITKENIFPGTAIDKP